MMNSKVEVASDRSRSGEYCASSTASWTVRRIDSDPGEGLLSRKERESISRYTGLTFSLKSVNHGQLALRICPQL